MLYVISSIALFATLNSLWHSANIKHVVAAVMPSVTKAHWADEDLVSKPEATREYELSGKSKR
jgi:hypothetical protein